METGFTPSDSSPSPTFSASLCACSSHGFSSLQSPSAFPSFSSDDSSQQIEALRLDFGECPSLLHRSRREATFDFRQDEFASRNSLTETFVASHEENVQDGSLCQESMTSSVRSLKTHLPSFLPGQVSLPASAGELVLWLHVPSPDIAQHSSTLSTFDSCGVRLKDGCAFPTQIFDKDNLQAHEKYAQVNCSQQADAHQAHETHGQIDQTPWINTDLHFNPSEVGPSVLTSFNKQVVFMANSVIGNDAVAYQSESRVQSLQGMHRLAPSPSASMRLESSNRTKQKPLQEILGRENVALSAIKEVITSSNPPLKALKENLAPQPLKQGVVEGRGLKADAAGWMCPRDAKKNFKPKPRQGLIDKWFIKQR